MKYFLTILFLLLSISFAAHHMLLKHKVVSQELLQDDELSKGNAEEQEGKEKKDVSEKYCSLLQTGVALIVNSSSNPVSYYHSLLSSGYINKTYTPPDFN